MNGGDDSFFAPSRGGLREDDQDVLALQADLRAFRAAEAAHARQLASSTSPQSNASDTADLSFFSPSRPLRAGAQQHAHPLARNNLPVHGESEEEREQRYARIEAEIQAVFDDPSALHVVDDSQEAEHEEGHEVEMEDEYETDSSIGLDPDEDPEGFAECLDELAGVLEMSEEEARALRWGPGIGIAGEPELLSVDGLQELVDHHLTSTDWQFAPMLEGERHPIRVLGRASVGREVGERIDPFTALRQLTLEGGLA